MSDAHLTSTDDKNIFHEGRFDGANNDTRTDAGATVASNSTVNGDLYTGNVIEVIQPNHAHHAVNNKVSIIGAEPDTLIVKTTSDLTVDGTVVSVGNTQPFTSFAGISTDRGDALLEEEIVNYVVNVGELTLTRGRVGSSAVPHASGVNIQPYEANGIPLVGINTTFNVPTNQANYELGTIFNCEIACT